MLSLSRVLGQRVSVHASRSRQLSYSHTRLFIGNFFGKKEVKQREEIIKNQDDYEVDPETKIVILKEENSPDYKPFNPEEDMPDFVIEQWKHQVVKPRDIEATYDTTNLIQTISQTYEETFQSPITQEEFHNASLSDLEARFKFAKSLQQNLGFDISDYTLSKSHTVGELFNALEKVINTRWTNERNPNAIVLRPADFSAPNVYLNQQPSERAQKATYDRIAEEARNASI